MKVKFSIQYISLYFICVSYPERIQNKPVQTFWSLHYVLWLLYHISFSMFIILKQWMGEFIEFLLHLLLLVSIPKLPSCHSQHCLTVRAMSISKIRCQCFTVGHKTSPQPAPHASSHFNHTVNGEPQRPLLGAHHFLHVSRIRVKLLTFRRLMSYIYGAPILDVSRSHTTTQHSR